MLHPWYRRPIEVFEAGPVPYLSIIGPNFTKLSWVVHLGI